MGHAGACATGRRRRRAGRPLRPQRRHRRVAARPRDGGRRHRPRRLGAMHRRRRETRAVRGRRLRPRRALSAIGHRPAGAGRTRRAGRAAGRPGALLRAAVGRGPADGARGALARGMHDRRARGHHRPHRAVRSAPPGGRRTRPARAAACDRHAPRLARARILPRQARRTAPAPRALRRHLGQPRAEPEGRPRRPARHPDAALDGAARARPARRAGHDRARPTGRRRIRHARTRTPRTRAPALWPAPGGQPPRRAPALRPPEDAGRAPGARGCRRHARGRADDAGLLP